MTLETFIRDFQELFDEPGEMTPETEFKKHPEWSSLTGLSVIAMIDEKYGVSLKGRDILKAATLAGLFHTVEEKQD